MDMYNLKEEEGKKVIGKQIINFQNQQAKEDIKGLHGDDEDPQENELFNEMRETRTGFAKFKKDPAPGYAAEGGLQPDDDDDEDVDEDEDGDEDGDGIDEDEEDDDNNNDF